MTRPVLGSTTVLVRGLQVFMRTGGPRRPGALPIVLVHGAVVSGRYMVPTAERLAATHEVLVPDLPGFGASESPARPLDVPGLADALIGVLDASGVQRAYLLGNSMGAQVIADAAARHPARVAGLILVGPTVERGARTRTRQLWRLALDAFRERPSLIPLHIADIFRAGWLFAVSSLDIALQDRIEEKLPRVSAPVLIVCGTRDPLAPPAWCTWLASRCPHAVLETIDGPHALNYSRPRELTRHVLEWLP